MDAGETIYSYYKQKMVVHALSSDEAGSGITSFQFSNDPQPTKNYGLFVSVADPSGVVRSVTNQFYDIETGYVTIEGSSFAEGDLVQVQGIKYV